MESGAYELLKKEIEYVDGLLQTYAEASLGGSAETYYTRYINNFSVPDKIYLAEKKIMDKVVYLKEHYVLLTDIRNDAEYQVLTIIMGEFKSSLGVYASAKRNRKGVST